ncbi:MAG: hypothetical protein WC498_01420 [Candidatus Saccharimonadales bacterium]
MYSKFRRIVSGLPLVIFLAILILAAVQRQAILDWWKLRGYQPPAAIVSLATDDSLTPQARHLLYVNRPGIASSAAFVQNCPTGGEKTIVLGCYKSGDNGIFIFRVSDPRLLGVEQVTTAHEMLHAAYDRLSSKDRSYVDGLLQNYYQHDLHDQRILDTIAAYKLSEPNDVVNEMHSVFGTEIANLPPALETYYQQYFSDRSKVTNFATTYKGEFTSRQTLVADYDSQMRNLKFQIDANQADLDQMKANLDTAAANLQQLQGDGNTSAYNQGVASYNVAVNTYNAKVQLTKNLINQYNTLVDKRNSVALEEQQLVQAITASPQTVQ